jgi:hypothetical protein
MHIARVSMSIRGRALVGRRPDGPRFATMPIVIFHGNIDWEPPNPPDCPSPPNPPNGCFNPTPLEQAAEIANDIGYSANSEREFSSTTNYFVGPSNVTSKQCPRGNALTPATSRKYDGIPTETACLAGPAGAPIPDATTVFNATCRRRGVSVAQTRPMARRDRYMAPI